MHFTDRGASLGIHPQPSTTNVVTITPAITDDHLAVPNPAPRRSFSVFGARPLSRGESSRKNSGACNMFKSRPSFVTPEEYEALPPSIQKKFFSSSERLRLTQELAARKRKKQATASSDERASTSSPVSIPDELPRPKSAHAYASPSMGQPVRQTQKPRSDADVDEKQAVHFMTLPDRVKRANFTTEELVLLTASSERALGLPPTKAVDLWKRFGGDETPHNDKRPATANGRLRTSTASPEATFNHDWSQFAFGSTKKTLSHSSANTFDGNSTPLSHHRQNSVASVQSTSTFPSVYTQSSVQPDWRRPSFTGRRSIALTPIPLPPPTLAPAVPPLPSPTTLHAMQVSVMPPSPPNHHRHIKNETGTQQKVRQYLSHDDHIVRAPIKTRTSPPSASSSGARSGPSTPSLEGFYYSDGDDESDAGIGPSDTRSRSISPATPANPRSLVDHKVSMDSGIDMSSSGHSSRPSFQSLAPSEHYQDSHSLHRTQSQHDTPHPETELYSFQRKQFSGVELEANQPLALETLAVCEDHTGAHGAFAVQTPTQGGLKKAWKTLRRRQPSV